MDTKELQELNTYIQNNLNKIIDYIKEDMSIEEVKNIIEKVEILEINFKQFGVLLEHILTSVIKNNISDIHTGTEENSEVTNSSEDIDSSVVNEDIIIIKAEQSEHGYKIL